MRTLYILPLLFRHEIVYNLINRIPRTSPASAVMCPSGERFFMRCFIVIIHKYYKMVADDPLPLFIFIKTQRPQKENKKPSRAFLVTGRLFSFVFKRYNSKSLSERGKHFHYGIKLRACSSFFHSGNYRLFYAA